MSKEVRDIRLVFLVFSAFFCFFASKHYPSIVSYALFCLAGITLFLIAFNPRTLRPLFKIWMKVARTVGKFNTQIILTLAFIIIFIPVALVMRLIRRDTMQKRFTDKSSYWEECKIAGVSDKKRYERQF